MATCKAKGCDGESISRGYCAKHYRQILRHGRLTPESENILGGLGCLVEGCNNTYYAKGYCKVHDRQIRVYGRLTPEREVKQERKCSVEGCGKKHMANGYCSKHNQQIRVHGRITPELERNTNGPISLVKTRMKRQFLYTNKKSQVSFEDGMDRILQILGVDSDTKNGGINAR